MSKTLDTPISNNDYNDLKQLFDIAPDGMRIIGKDFNMIRMNKSFETMCGVPMEEAIGKKCYDVFNGEFCHNDNCPLTQIVEKKSGIIQVTAKKYTRDRKEIPCRITASPFLDENGEIMGIVEDFNDISESLAMQEELMSQLELVTLQNQAIREMSTPILEIWDDVLALPVMGVIDTARATEMTDKLLEFVSTNNSKGVIIDITGIDVMDTKTADYFIKMAKAIKLLGSTPVITGISPAIAQTLTHIGIDLHGIHTMRCLRDGLKWFQANTHGAGK